MASQAGLRLEFENVILFVVAEAAESFGQGRMDLLEMVAELFLG